jgi:hypothetical protein
MKLTEYKKLPTNLFGLIFWNILSLFLPIFIALGILALLGIKPVEFNDQPTYGIVGLITSLAMGPFMSFVTAFAIWSMLKVGNFIFKLFVKNKE